MKKQIKHISVHQTSKIIALVHFVISAIICIPLGLFTYFSTRMPEALILVIYPIFIIIFAYIWTAILVLLYNWLASFFGGIEVSVSDAGKRPGEELPQQGL